jgi:hypothetical protein
MSSSKQVAVCTLSLSSNAPAEAKVRLSMPWCANSRAALQKARIVIDHDHDCRLRHHIRVQPRGAYCPLGVDQPIDLDPWNLVRHEHTTNGSSPVEAQE